MEINELLSRFWEGETSLEEEKMLKNFFRTVEADKFPKKQNIFAAFDKAKAIGLNGAQFEKEFFTRLHYRKQKSKVRTLYVTALSMVASVAFAVFMITQTQQSEAFVVEQGVRKNDVEQAYNYADKALNEALMPLRQSMQSLAPIKGLEGSLMPSSYSEKNTILDSNLINN
ncbi:MAG: hypothetical protein LBR75_05265 [Prevotellaceae bacterium]|jgi:hypothetical protein|nr:hypothetical protein [Prevotellaceae bacterium]